MAKRHMKLILDFKKLILDFKPENLSRIFKALDLRHLVKVEDLRSLFKFKPDNLTRLFKSSGLGRMRKSGELRPLFKFTARDQKIYTGADLRWAQRMRKGRRWIAGGLMSMLAAYGAGHVMDAPESCAERERWTVKTVRPDGSQATHYTGKWAMAYAVRDLFNIKCTDEPPVEPDSFSAVERMTEPVNAVPQDGPTHISF